MSPRTPQNPFSVTAIQQAEKDVQDVPQNQLQAGVTNDPANGWTGEIEGEKDLGHDWSAVGDASWSQKLKWKVAAFLRWTPK